MNIIISLATKDFQIVKKVVRYCRLYLQTEEESIFLITKIGNKIFFQHSWIKQNHVTLIDEDNMIPGLSFAKVKEYLEIHFKEGTHIYPGWYLQQFLKMGFALTPYAGKEYLIWDSDTIPLHKLCFKNKDKYLLTVKTENHTPYFDTMQRIFGFGKLCDCSFIAEHMPINTQIMKELISQIENSQVPGVNWFEKIINATSGTDEQGFSEFETYGNYCIKYHPDIFETRALTTMRTAGLLYGRGVTSRQLALLAKMEFDTASFELRHIPAFPRNIANWRERFFLAFLRKLKIVK